jgi:hypothetical protein
VLIVGLIGAIAIPQATGLHNGRLMTAANMLASDIEFCQSQCINDPGYLSVLVFDVPNNQYRIALAATPTVPISHPADSQPYVTDFATGRSAALTGVTLSGTANLAASTLGFDSFGRPSITQNATVTLAADGNQMTLTIDAATGEVTIGAAVAVGP